MSSAWKGLRSSAAAAALGLGLALGGTSASAEPVEELVLLTWAKAQFPVEYEAAILLAEGWSQLGLELDIQPANFPNPLIERVFVKRDFDAALINFTAQLQRLDPEFYTYNAFHSDRAAEGGWNFAGLTDPELDKLLEAQRAEYDFDKRKAMVADIQSQLNDKNPWLVMVNFDELQAYNSDNFKDPVLPKVSGFRDAVAFFTLKPTGERKVVRWGVPMSDLKTINPVIASESSQVRLVYLIYDTLMKIGPNTEPQLWMITEITPIDDTTIEVTLRDGLTFHDGKPVTAEDVAFTFNYMKEKKAAYYTSTLEQLERAEAVAPNKVRFTLAAPYAPFTTQTLAMVPILPMHVWSGIEDPSTFENVPAVGSGPYQFDYWTKGREFKVSRFADHFQPADNDGLLVIFFGTAEAAYTALTRQDIDVVDKVLPYQLIELEGLDFITPVSVPSNGSITVVLNLRNAPMDDPAFREALSLATPRQRALMELFEGYGTLGASVIGPANEYWHEPGVTADPYDIEAARKVLEEAGYSWSDDGRLQLPQ